MPIAKLTIAWMLISLSALTVVWNCVAAPTAQRQRDDANPAVDAALDAAAEEAPLVRGWPVFRSV